MNSEQKENTASSANGTKDELESAWDGVLAEMMKETLNDFVYFQLGRAYSPHTKPEDITMEYAMNIQHLIIPKKVSDYVVEFHNKVCKLKHEWNYGATSCNSKVWQQFMYPEMKKVQSLLKKEKWQEVFGSLFGIYLYDRRDSGEWISDQEEYEVSMANFSGWFRKYSTSWKKLLERSDEEIGLNCTGGLPDGYREALLDMLKQQQEYLNTSVLGVFDEFAPRKIRINIIPEKSVKAKSPGKKKAKTTESPTSSKKGKVE